LGKILEVRFGLLERARRRTAPSAASDTRLRLDGTSERHDLVGVEQRGRRGAVGNREALVDCPGILRNGLIDHAERGRHLCACFLYSIRVLLVVGPQPVTHDLLHRQVNVEVEEAIAESYLPRKVGVRRNEPDLSRIVLIEVLDNDTRLRDRAVARAVLMLLAMRSTALVSGTAGQSLLFPGGTEAAFQLA
jgi:hypothetical protein